MTTFVKLMLTFNKFQAKYSMEDSETRERDCQVHSEGGYERERGPEREHGQHADQNEQDPGKSYYYKIEERARISRDQELGYVLYGNKDQREINSTSCDYYKFSSGL